MNTTENTLTFFYTMVMKITSHGLGVTYNKTLNSKTSGYSKLCCATVEHGIYDVSCCLAFNYVNPVYYNITKPRYTCTCMHIM